MSSVVMVGGFFTSDGALEKVAEAAVDEGWGDRVGDVIAFPDFVREPDSVRQAVAGNVAIFHSAGNLAIDYALEKDPPETVVSANGVEPRHAALLIWGGVRRQAGLFRTGYFDNDEQDPEGYRAVAWDSLIETVTKPHRYFPEVRRVSQYSTATRLNVAAARGITTVRIHALDDKMYPHKPQVPIDERVLTVGHEGGHDAILRDPGHILYVARRAFSQPED